MNTSVIIEKIDKSLHEKASGKSKHFWCKYLKETVNFIGVGIPEVRKTTLQVINEYELSKDDYRNLVLELLKIPVAEHKLSGILIMENFFHVVFSDSEILEICGKIYEEKHIYDWSTSDWLCVRVLTPLIDRGARDVIESLASWRGDEYLWKSRASLVSFAQAESIVDHIDLIIDISGVLIKSEERFSKTAVGWVLREVSKHDEARVLDFLRENSVHLTGEVIGNATKYLDKKKQKEIKKELKKLSGRL